ncbi:hypothetical protein BD324DRAFT_610472 [Kockovaella imperatae]|uniref:Uncharacterized protein n=1 Tax=Kockovaella imperatae TaxID=4999 RepID=A0A1Y1U733_9TREE|nr:hypothetical protein BD324DRAFT_610472 [Kockovaella imperatae]ORX33840.1 hypothetical protein BD324DRAFT_610472 [Kockovaella imperatae]
MRREFDCWVEQCWVEAFHSVFVHDVPSLLIQLIILQSSPQFLRKQIVHGGSAVDKLFQTQMLKLLFAEIERRLSGHRISEAGPSTPSPTSPAQPFPSLLPRDGVCFDSLAALHGTPKENDDHGMCLCQLTTCTGCFHTSGLSRRGPHCLLPFELTDTPHVTQGFAGKFETEAQATKRIEDLKGPSGPALKPQNLPQDVGFVRHSRNRANGDTPLKPPILFQHPQMTDVLAVEEHIRWRLKEMGATDPAVETRYGPSKNDPAALEGIDLPETDGKTDDGDKSTASAETGAKKMRVVKVQRGKGKVRRVVDGPNKTKDEEKDKARCFLPSTWTDETAQARNTAIVLTFRHFVKLLHQVAISVSPFSYPSYADDVLELSQVHPVAMYRRLAEPSVTRRKNGTETRAWQECMDKWTEELGAKEKAQGNKYVSAVQHRKAVDYYTRAISLDSKKTVYYSNRAVALNALGEHSRAEQDCKHILLKDSKNGKAFFQRAMARRGLGRWREAEADLKEVLRYQPGNDSAKKMMMLVKGEIAKLPKQTVEDAMDF